MTTLLSRLLGRGEPALGRPVIVYTRTGCGCCEKALDLLNTHQRKYDLSIELINVDSDPALAELHGDSVPVVAIDGKVRFRGLVNPVLLERILRKRED